jgi:hypothetical protein
MRSRQIVPSGWCLLVLGVLPSVACLDGLDVSGEEPVVGTRAGGLEVRAHEAGQFPAVARIENRHGFDTHRCGATLISHRAMLTTAGCVCADIYLAEGDSHDRYDDCLDRTRVLFKDAARLDGSTEDMWIGARVVVRRDGTDDAVLLLDIPAHEVLDVQPMELSPTLPAVGEIHRRVQWGIFDQPYPVCRQRLESMTLRFGLNRLEYSPGLDADVTCLDEESGQPMINAAGQVAAVSSFVRSQYHDFDSYAPTADAWTWLQSHACAPYDPAATEAQCTALCPCSSGEGECDSHAECRLGTECIPEAGELAGLEPDSGVCWSAQQLVSLYREASYGGVHQSVPFGTWDVDALTVVGNDSITSLKAAPGLTVRLFAEGGCSGSSLAYAGNVPQIATALNDRTSCVQVRPGVTVYEDVNYGGQSRTFEVGAHGHQAFAPVGNDAIESMRASPGIQVRLCSESGGAGGIGWGRCVVKSGTDANLIADEPGISNVEVFPAVTVYRDTTFRGPSATFRPGIVGPLDLGTLHEGVSSLVVAPGLRARLCSGAGGTGDCETFTDWTSAIGSRLDDRTAWIEISEVPWPRPRPWPAR